MDWIRIIQNAINYIESHLLDEIDQEEIARSVYTSVYQFNRAFSMIAGVSVGEYIRNRRLSLAARELRCGKEKVIDLALKYGYESPESFTKAFTRFHGESPSNIRLSEMEPRFFHPLTIQINVKGGFNMSKKLLADLRSLIDGMKGHNYALPDCLKYIFECVGDYEEITFWDIAAVIGDTIAQVYNSNLSTRCDYCVSGHLADADYIEYVFSAFGYEHDYVTAAEIIANKSHYRQKIMEYIDKGIPVLVKTNINDVNGWKADVGTYCLIIGYENDGGVVKLLVKGEMIIDYAVDNNNKLDLIFIREKHKDVSLEELYLNTIKKMPYWLTLPERNGMCFGAEAYRKWANDIEAGRFVDENLPLWHNYGVYVCNIATSGAEATFIYKKLADMNNAYLPLVAIGKKIQELLPPESSTGGRSLLWIKLDELEAGMDMDKTAVTMHDATKRKKVAMVLREYADKVEQAVKIMNQVVHDYCGTK